MQEVITRGLRMCVSKAAFAAGTTTTFSTTGATLFCVDGKAHTAAAKTNEANPTTDANTGAAFVPVAADNGSVFVIGYNTASTPAVKVMQGTVEPLDAGGNFVRAPLFPAIPGDVAPFAYMVIKVAAGGTTWTYGTSNSASVTGVTYTRQDVMTLPARPQVA